MVPGSGGLVLSLLLSLLVLACGSSKRNAESSGIQNFRVRYNILFNANQIIQNVRKQQESTSRDDYTQVLPLFVRPQSDKHLSTLLDSVAGKAKRIIFERSKSDYIDEAYMLLGDASYLKANYYDAVAYYNYIYQHYRHDKNLMALALAKKALSQINLGFREEARISLDTAFANLNPGSSAAAMVYETAAELLIKEGKFDAAAENLAKAIPMEKDSKQNWRNNYVLAQIEESRSSAQAKERYLRIARSNAPFEMSFNALLSYRNLSADKSDSVDPRITGIEEMLRKDRYELYKNLIYFRLAEIYQQAGNKEEAMKNYRLANRFKNELKPEITGLSYKSMAELSFNRGDYPYAKLFYDSSLVYLSDQHPASHEVKARLENLLPLSAFYKAIAREEAFQKGKAYIEIPDIPVPPAASASTPVTARTFYFNNERAVRQGMSDFRRLWGTRANKDNWRNADQSIPTEAQGAPGAPAPAPLALPAPPSMRSSRERMARAYYQLGLFFLQSMNDREQAVNTFKELISRLPGSSYAPPAYYELYRLLKDSDAGQAAIYKAELSSKFPGSNYAIAVEGKTNLTIAEETLYAEFSSVYKLLEAGDYSRLIRRVDSISANQGRTPLAAQFNYLKTLAIGYSSPLAAFEQSVREHISAFPDDQLATPLANQHLVYIAAHRSELEQRIPVLLKADSFFPAQDAPTRVRAAPATAASTAQEAGAQKPASEEARRRQDLLPDSGTIKSAAISGGSVSILTPAPAHQHPGGAKIHLPERAEYYFVVNVNSASLDLSPSRFGMGQFNRSRYGGKITHRLKTVKNSNSLIFNGPFESLTEVKAYEQAIMPLITDIMKLASERYNTFVSTKENLDALSSAEAIEQYAEDYRNTK